MRSLKIVLAFVLALASCTPDAKLLDSPMVKDLDAGKAGGKSTFDHSVFDAFLQAVVTEEDRVDYEAAKAQSAGLNAYLKSLEGAKLSSLPPKEQKALLINAYNAFTLKLIVEHYPVKSIRDLDAPWKTKRYKLAGYTVSLDNIEHGILRPYFLDERIHFAVNCASVGCPPLSHRAYRGKQLDKQLDAAARRTLRDPKHARVENGTLLLTNILNWYGADFTNPAYRGHAKTLPAYVARFASDDVKQFVKKSGGNPKVGWLEYDWALNGTKR